MTVDPSVVETHISVLFFLGDRVYKMRKKVTTPFLDFSTRELRLADCRREVALNRRLAPDVYLGVDDVVDETGQPVEHLVVMRRLPSERRLATMIAAPTFDADHLARVARALAGFHARAERSPAISRAGSIEHLTMLWSTNLDETQPFLGSWLDADLHALIRQSALAYLEGRQPLLTRRIFAGRIVDGHGDLMAEDVFCLDDGPRILDCVEFDPLFRWGDVLSDAAFLAMDLEHLGRPDLGRVFLDRYREFSGETHPESLEHWYIAYRALVRAKVSCLCAAGGDPGAPAQADRFLRQTARHLAAAEVHLVLVGGLPGTGKSTVAQDLADRFAWDLFRADVLRKELAGISPGSHAYDRPFAGLYTAQATAATYAELLSRARIALAGGDSVVLDASWLDPAQRAAARALASDTRSTLHELCCLVDLPEAERRIRARVALGADASDATPEVLATLATRTQVPWEGATVIDTSRPPDRALHAAIAAVRPDLLGGPEG